MAIFEQKYISLPRFHFPDVFPRFHFLDFIFQMYFPCHVAAMETLIIYVYLRLLSTSSI